MPPRKRVSSSRSPVKPPLRTPRRPTPPPLSLSEDVGSSPDPIDSLPRPTSVAQPSAQTVPQSVPDGSPGPKSRAAALWAESSRTTSAQSSHSPSIGSTVNPSRKRKSVRDLEEEDNDDDEWGLFKNDERTSASPEVQARARSEQSPRTGRPFELSPTKRPATVSKSPDPSAEEAAVVSAETEGLPHDGEIHAATVSVTAQETDPKPEDTGTPAEPVVEPSDDPVPDPTFLGDGDDLEQESNPMEEAAAVSQASAPPAGPSDHVDELQEEVFEGDGQPVPLAEEERKGDESKSGPQDDNALEPDTPGRIAGLESTALHTSDSAEKAGMDELPAAQEYSQELRPAPASHPATDTDVPASPLAETNATAKDHSTAVKAAQDEPTATLDQQSNDDIVLRTEDASNVKESAAGAPETLVAETPALANAEEGEEELDDDVNQTSEAVNEDDQDVDMEDASATAETAPAKSTPAAKPKPAPKKKAATTQAKSKTKQAAANAAKKSSKTSKSKSKVDDLKTSKSSASRATPDSVNGTSVSVASAEARGASPESEPDLVYCVCRKRESEDDDDVLMVGCESCEDWFHASCMNLTQEQVDNLDVYICKACERSTKQKTVYKQSCKRDGCHKGLGGRDSKFCSDVCAYKHMKAFTDSITVKKTLKQLSTAFASYPKPPTVQIVQHADTQGPVVETPNATQHLLSVVQDQMTAASAALDLVRKRQQILQQAIDHAESLAPIAITQEESRGSSKTKRKGGGGGPIEDKQCAWDPRLVWTDDEVKAWTADSAEAKEMEGVCELPKKRCDRHSGWQRTIAISLEVEERQLDQQQTALVEQHDGLMKSAETAKESDQARSAFKQKLAAKRRT